VQVPKIDREYFRDWRETSRVRKVQQAYEQMVADAVAKGIDITAEMKQRKFRNYAEFIKSCPRFQITCWPSELAELGSGFVLYFHFLSFLMMVLLIAFLVQLPAVIDYMGAEELAAWNTDPRALTRREKDNCGCVGTNNNHFVATSQADYGTYCKAWDKDWCANSGPNNSFIDYSDASKRGRWCCRSWCYARVGSGRDKCPTTQDPLSPSLSNRMESGAQLIRSYTACGHQDAADLAICDADPHMSKDIAYPAGSYEDPDDLIEEWYNTAGNLGPEKGTNTAILMCYVVLVAFLAFAIVAKSQYQQRVDSEVDVGTTQPNDFAILVEGLPPTMTDESVIMDFFKEHAIKGKTDTEVVKVVIGWDAAEYREKIRGIRTLTTTLKKMDPSDPQTAAIRKQIMEIKVDLVSCAPDMASRLRSSGVVVVIFRHERDQRCCLERWHGFWGRYFYRDSAGCGGLLRGAELPRFPIGDPPRPVYRLRVSRAPNPGDINWEDLGVPFQERLKMMAKTNGAMCVVVMMSFGFCYFMKWLQRQMDSPALVYLTGIGIAVANAAVNVAAKIFGKQEYHTTLTQQSASQGMKMAIGMIANTAGVIILLNLDPKEWYMNDGLVNDICTVILIVGFMRPLAVLALGKFDVKSCIRKCSCFGWRKIPKITDEELEKWNKMAERQVAVKGKFSKEEQQEFNQCQARIDMFRKMHEPSEADMTKPFAYAINIFVCCILYCPLVPAVSLFGIFALGMQYWVDKYLVVRVVRRPTIPLNSLQAMQSLAFMRYLVLLGLPSCTLLFLSPSWKNKDDILAWFIISLVPALSFCVVPLSVARTLLLLRCLLSRRRVQVSEDDKDDYYKAQHMWPREFKYHKSHFLYKGLPDSKNPEFLKPGVRSIVNVDEVKGGYSTAASSEADSAAQGKTQSIQVSKKYGGLKTAASTSSDDPPVVAVTSTISPTVIGAAPKHREEDERSKLDSPVPVCEPEPVVPISTATPEPAPVVAPKPTPAPEVAPVITEPAPAAEPTKPTWEFETKSGFKKFDDDCHDYIERKYREHKDGGPARIRVKTGHIHLSLDFHHMTQMVEGKDKTHGQKRAIRRSQA